jgi:hypothetical protein
MTGKIVKVLTTIVVAITESSVNSLEILNESLAADHSEMLQID